MIDVSDLLLDPDFVEESAVSRLTRIAVVNEYGENVISETQTYITASVQAGNGEILKRLPQATQLTDWITVYSKVVLNVDGVGKYPDIIVYKSRRYNVQLLTDFSNWGEGYTRADCLLEGGGNG